MALHLPVLLIHSRTTLDYLLDRGTLLCRIQNYPTKVPPYTANILLFVL